MSDVEKIWNEISHERLHMYFCHMDIKYADNDWTEAETVKTFSKEKAQTNFKEVQDLRNKGVLVKNLKLCRVAVIIEEEEEEEENEKNRK